MSWQGAEEKERGAGLYAEELIRELGTGVQVGTEVR